MTYPTKIDFDNAVWNLDKTIRCQDFNGGTPRNDDIDLVYYTGGFSRVYLVDLPKPKRTVVLRVWLSDIPDAELLYSQAGKYFEKNPNPYFVNFRYISEGIEVNRKIWPVLYMEWVNGLTLNQFLDQNLPSTPGRVNQVAEQFLEMTKRLHEDQISHGDLQDGNILVSNHRTSMPLKLIDYDTLYISGISSGQRQVVGLSGYQHPNRARKKLDQEKWDYFSELVIYLSLRAYAERPKLWKPHQEKVLLFTKADFADPEHSEVFTTLNSMSAQIRSAAKQLKDYCHETNLNRLQPIENIIASIPLKSKFSFRNGRTAETLEELVGICDEHPDDAIYHFVQGDFEPWLQDIGRRDLADYAGQYRQSTGTPLEKLVGFLKMTGVSHRLLIPIPKPHVEPKPVPVPVSVPQQPSSNGLLDFVLIAFLLFIIGYGAINSKIIDVSSTFVQQVAQVKQGDIVIMVALSGEWSADYNNPDFPMVNANGYTNEFLSSHPAWKYSDWCGSYDPTANWPLGVLYAGVFGSPSYNQVGTGTIFMVKDNGTLFFSMNDCSFQDNYGNIRVLVTKYPNPVRIIQEYVGKLNRQ